MDLVWLSLLARWRRAWLPSLFMALLVGVIGGFVIAAAAAARRVDVSYQALLSEIDAPDLLVMPACGSSAITGCTGPPSAADGAAAMERLQRDAAVEQIRPIAWVRPYLVASDGTPLLATADNPSGCFDGDRSVGFVALNDGDPRDQALPFRLIGDLPRDPDGVVLTRATAERVGVGLGDRFTVGGWCTGDGDLIEVAEPIELVLSGVSIGAFDVEPPGSGLTIEPAFVDEAVLEAMYAANAERRDHHAVWLRDGSTATVTRQLDGFDVEFDTAEHAASIDDALDVDARPLWILASAGAVMGLLLLAPIIVRSIRADHDDVLTLVALGCTRAQIGVRAVAHIVVVGAAGVLMAIAIAPLVAATLPLGLAGAIVTDRVWLDPLVTALGVVLLVAALATVAALSAWRFVAGRRTSRPVTSLTTDHVVARLRLRPPAQTGVLAAVGRPGGRRLVSPWPGLVSLILACTVCVGGLTYVAGLRHLESSPELLGWNWDAAVFVDDDTVDRSSVVAEVGQLDGVELATTGTFWPPVFMSTPGSDLQIWPWSFATGFDAIAPVIVQGRAPQGPDEVAIDLVFRDLTGLGPGDTVRLERPTLADQVADEIEHMVDRGTRIDPPEHDPLAATFEITGIAVLPIERSHVAPQTSFTLAGLDAFTTPSVDEVEATRAWLPDDLPLEILDEVETRLTDLDVTDRLVYVRTEGDLRDVAARLGELDGVEEVMAPRPLEVVTLLSALNLAGTDNVPLALGILTAVASLALVSYLLVATMRARRAELALLRALGVSGWGVRASLAVQATSTVALVLAVAVPTGVAIGRWAWSGYARDLLVVPEATTPWVGILTLVAGALVVANLLALLVAQVGIRRPATRELRAE